MSEHNAANNRDEALEYVANRARHFIRVATIYDMTPATKRAWEELSEALAELKAARATQRDEA